MDESRVLSSALACVRNAVVGFLAEDDASDESLFLAAQCLGVEGLLVELGIEPDLVVPTGDPSEELDAAGEVLAASQSAVPLPLWAALQAVRVRAAR